MTAPGLAFAERVRVATVAGEIATLGFAIVGRRALDAGRPADRLAGSEASRYLGSVGDAFADLAPDALGLRALAEEVRDALVGSNEFATLGALLEAGSLRQVTVGLVTSLRSGVGDVASLLTPTADRSFAVSLDGIDGLLRGALRSLADPSSGSSSGSDGHSLARAAAGAGSRDAVQPAAALDGVRVSTVVLGLLGRGKRSFSSPLSVPKSPVSKH